MAEGKRTTAPWAADPIESLCLTRSSTIFHALLRIYGCPEHVPSSLVLHIVGADHREGNTSEQSQKMFEPLFLHLACRCENIRTLHMLFCGPNVAAPQHGAKHSFQFTALNCSTDEVNSTNIFHGEQIGHSSADTKSSRTSMDKMDPSGAGDGAGQLAVTLQYISGLYHDVSFELDPGPDAMFLFNAGLWGYDDWTATLEYILLASRTGTRRPKWSQLTAVVVTSYCSEEAEDDMDTIEQLLCGGGGNSRSNPASLEVGAEDAADMGTVGWLWRPEINPHRSLLERRSACAVEGRRLFENHSWQAVRPPTMHT